MFSSSLAALMFLSNTSVIRLSSRRHVSPIAFRTSCLFNAFRLSSSPSKFSSCISLSMRIRSDSFSSIDQSAPMYFCRKRRSSFRLDWLFLPPLSWGMLMPVSSGPFSPSFFFISSIKSPFLSWMSCAAWHILLYGAGAPCRFHSRKGVSLPAVAYESYFLGIIGSPPGKKFETTEKTVSAFWNDYEF